MCQEHKSPDLSPTQLQMVIENIIADVRRYYSLSPWSNTWNFRQDETPKSYNENQRDTGKEIQQPKGDIVLKCIDFKQPSQ